VAELKTDATVETVNGALKAAAEGPMKGILVYCDEPLVSIDFNHCSASSSVDALSTKVLEGRMVKVLSWYDNEWGYSCRTIELAAMMAK
jgi:glyceraldehyde 3-phosphate dehydrogenase